MTTRAQKLIGNILRDKREGEGNSLRLVSKHTKIDFALIGRAERGLHKLSFENAVVLCEYYGLPIQRLADFYKPKRKGTPQ